MSADRYGCLLSSQNLEAISFVNEFSHHLLSSGKKMEKILEGVKKFPDEIILQIYATIFYLFEQTIEGQKKAAEHLDQTSRLLSKANDREKSLYSFAWLWLNKLFTEALKNIERHCFKWPRDLTALKMAEFLFYYKGFKYENQRFLRLTNHIYYEYKEDPSYLAIHSFALEHNEKYDDCYQIIQKALKLNKNNPEAQHSLAHLFLNRGMIDKGIYFLEHYSHLWKDINLDVKSHNFWHLALFYLENLDFHHLFQTYEKTWLNQTQSLSQIIDATTLLWRLEIEEIAPSLLWVKLAESISDRANFPEIPFISALLLFALKKGNREAALVDALSKIENFALEQIKEDRIIWRDVGLPLIYGSLAYAEKNYSLAYEYYKPIIEQVACVGGSDAQIDLFFKTYLKILVGVRRYWDAEKLLNYHTQGRNLTKLERNWFVEWQKSAALASNVSKLS